MTKLWLGPANSITDVVRDGDIVAVGGFGLSGNPVQLIDALVESGARNLTIVSNNMGVDGKSLGRLLESKQVSKVMASYVGENKLFAQQYMSGELDVEFVPQGTLAERLRAGGAGIPAFFTRTGVGTPVAEGKPTEIFDGVTYVMERGIVADVALVHAYRADRAGNLIYRHAARNFNPLVATAGRVTIVESEHIIDDFLDPDIIVTPGIFVQRLIEAETREKDIEQRTTRPRGIADLTQSRS